MDGYKDLMVAYLETTGDLMYYKNLEGRLEAAQDYINSASYIDVKILCTIIGLEVKKNG